MLGFLLATGQTDGDTGIAAHDQDVLKLVGDRFDLLEWFSFCCDQIMFLTICLRPARRNTILLCVLHALFYRYQLKLDHFRVQAGFFQQFLRLGHCRPCLAVTVDKVTVVVLAAYGDNDFRGAGFHSSQDDTYAQP